MGICQPRDRSRGGVELGRRLDAGMRPVEAKARRAGRPAAPGRGRRGSGRNRPRRRQSRNGNRAAPAPRSRRQFAIPADFLDIAAGARRYGDSLRHGWGIWRSWSRARCRHRRPPNRASAGNCRTSGRCRAVGGETFSLSRWPSTRAEPIGSRSPRARSERSFGRVHQPGEAGGCVRPDQQLFEHPAPRHGSVTISQLAVTSA